MLEKKTIRFIVRFIPMLCLGTLAACQAGPVQTERLENLDSDPSVPAQSSTPAAAVSSTSDNLDPNDNLAPNDNLDPNEAVPSQPSTAYQDAVNLASGAFTLGQQATSPDDWDLIVGRWEQAIQKLKEVPKDDQHHATAQTKLEDYGRNLAQAKQRLVTLKQPPAEITLNRPAQISNQATTAVSTTSFPDPGNPIPIIERHGGTPVIEVTFNDRRYPMILDTGASHTHITRAMANELGVQAVGQASVTTASSNQVVVDVGYIDSIRVGTITHRNLPVSIGDSLPIGLLGNDVYKNFDVILQVNSVEFRPR